MDILNHTFYNPVKITQMDLPTLRARLAPGFGCRRVGVLASRRAVREHGLADALKALGTACDVVWIDDTPGNPTFDSVAAALARFGAEKPQRLIAIGGGSAIDTAKALSALAEERWPLDAQQVRACIAGKGYLRGDTGIAITAVPTTAGSGAELTMWGTLWDPQALKKYSVEAPWLFPREAWLVPELTATMPPRLTLSTGLDALTHAVEAWWSVKSNPVVRALAADAIEHITAALPQALARPDDLDARARMMHGALFAAMAFSNTRTAACHALSYPLTMRFGIEHGFAVALTLPQMLCINWPAMADQPALLRAFGVGGPQDIGVWLDGLCAGIQPLRLSAFGVDAAAAAAALAGELAPERMGNNPVPLNAGDVERILQAIR